MFNLTLNYFELFGIPAGYSIDSKQLKTKYLELQRRYHPDNFASESESIQRQAVQQVSYLNQAYDTLRSPLKLAVYLLELSGHEYDPDTQIHDDVGFLMEQMELREELSDIESSDHLDSLRSKAVKNFKSYQEQFAECYEAEKWQQAGIETNKMMFISKLISEIDEKEEVLFS